MMMVMTVMIMRLSVEREEKTRNLAWRLEMAFVRRGIVGRAAQVQIVEQWLETFRRRPERSFDAVVLYATLNIQLS